jgi:non-specific serine/threonine protein kinase
LRQKHAERFLALAEEADRNLESEAAATDVGFDREWLDRLEHEIDNLRAALDWLRESNEGQLSQRLAGALDDFWCSRDHVPEGHRFLEAAVALDDGHTPARAKALLGAAHMARDKGDSALAALRAEQAVALYRELGDGTGVAHSLLWLGQAVADHGKFAEARRAFEESAQLFTVLGKEHDAVVATRMLAWMLRELGDWPSARALHETNLERARRLGNRRIEASTLGALASYAIEEGRAEDAALLAGQSLRRTREVGSTSGVATELCRCAGALMLFGRAETAVRLLACSDALFEQTGTSMLPYLASENEPIVRGLRGQLGEAAFERAWAAGRRLTIDEGVELALASLD